MTVQQFLNTNLGITLGFILTWTAAVWAYKKNVEDHSRLGGKVDSAKSEMLQSVKELGDKIDAVRDAITHHETVWHAPQKPVRSTQKRRAARKK